jgi:DNA polymerase-3 subunit epsilon
MREIVFDTETTGRTPEQGDRIVEIGCVELWDRVPTGRTWHAYVNPEREVPEEVVKVHGLTTQFLRAHPTFADAKVCEALLEFVGEAPLVAHNAEFDRRFLNAELERLRKPLFAGERFVDTLQLARKRFPGASNSLDALCKRFNISLTTRDKHGALIDARLLAEVYLELHGGREQTLAFMEAQKNAVTMAVVAAIKMERRPPRPQPLASLVTAEDEAAHAAFIDGLGGDPLWKKLS